MAQDDADLVRQTLAGEVESFGRLIGRHQGAVQGLAFHLSGSFADAQDIAQETFVAAYLKLGQLRQPECFPAWLRQLAVNCGRMWLRARRPHAPLGLEATRLAASDPTPAEAYERAAARRQVHRALDRLSEDHRLVLVLHYLGGLDGARIAAFLEVPPSTVEGRLRRAQAQLRGRLMSMVEDTLHDEALAPGFAQTALEEALKRAGEARERWAGDEFVRACHQAMEAAVRLADARQQIGVLSMLGEADATWLGAAAQAIEHYASAIELARTHQDRAEEARLLKELAAIHGRQGRFEGMRAAAGQALDLFAGLEDRANQAMMAAAVELAGMLPGRWQPGKPGGYAMAAFAVALGPEGHRFLDPVFIREYSWGCPSRGAALAHLLHPRRFLGPTLEPGTAWEDRLAAELPGLSWGIDGGDELLARSVVESADELVVAPAGRFAGCLRVKTCIETAAGGRGKEYTTRSFCGTRMAWYAPGVGLVKLRHVDQNDIVWSVYLAGCEGAGGGGYFPLDLGRAWRYRWNNSLSAAECFEDCCRVVSSDGGTAFVASATLGVELTAAEGREGLEQATRLDRAAGDLEGEALGLWEVVCRLEDGEAERRVACLLRLIEITEVRGDQWRLFDARWELRQVREGLTPQQQTCRLEEREALARRLGDRPKRFETICRLASHHRRSERCQEAAGRFEEAADLAREEGDARAVAVCVAEAELCRAMSGSPLLPEVAYLCGQGELIQQDDGSLDVRGSGRSLIDGRPFPPGPTGTPMLDFFYHTPFAGISLLSGKIGATASEGLNTRVVNYCEHMRQNSALKSISEAVAAPAGTYDSCALIETRITTSAEDLGGGPQVEQEHAYYAGVKRAWYAPGVGLVRLRYQHCNGCETDIQLVGYELAEASPAYLPLAPGNRWRYRWTDPETGTLFEDTLRVASRDGQRWYIAFVTRATACHPAG